MESTRLRIEEKYNFWNKHMHVRDHLLSKWNPSLSQMMK